MEQIIYLCMSYFERHGCTFLHNAGRAVAVEFKGDNRWYWFSDSPYKLRHSDKWREWDAYSEISSLKVHKKYWQEKCQEDLDDLLDADERESYQVTVNTQDLTRHECDVERFLESYDILKLSSPMATRKSNVIDETIKQSHARGLRVLMVTNRVSLSLDIAEKYKSHDVKHYQSHMYDRGDSLVVQFDSLFYYNQDDFDVIILDEVSSLLMYMSSNNYKGKEWRYRQNIEWFLNLKDKKVLLSDAFILKHHFKGSVLGIYNEFRENLKVTEYYCKYTFISKVVREASKGVISVSANEKGILNKIRVRLEAKGAKVLLLTAETRNKDKIYKELEQNKSIYDAILFSPTLTVGVSIFSNIYHHFHYDTSGTVSVVDSIQMTRRVRNAKNIHYYIRGRVSSRTTDMNNILNHDRGLNPFRMQNKWGESFGLTDAGKILAGIKQTRNILTNTHKYAFKRLLKYQFVEVYYNTVRGEKYKI